MIFYVEDDNEIKSLVLYTLTVSGFKAKGFSCGDELFNELKTDKSDLITLDIMLPGEDGVSIIRKPQNSI